MFWSFLLPFTRKLEDSGGLVGTFKKFWLRQQQRRVSLSVIKGIVFLKICGIKILNCVLERWLGSQEHLLFLPWAWIWFVAPHSALELSLTLIPGEPTSFLGTHVVHIKTCRETTQTHKIKISKSFR